MITGLCRQCDFTVRQSAFRADQKTYPAVSDLQIFNGILSCGIKVKTQIFSLFRQKFFQIFSRIKFRNCRSSALFTGTDNDFPPLFLLLLHTLRIKSYAAAAGDERGYFRNSEFHRFLESELHPFPAADDLGKMQIEGGFVFYFGTAGNHGCYMFFI